MRTIGLALLIACTGAPPPPGAQDTPSTSDTVPVTGPTSDDTASAADTLAPAARFTVDPPPLPYHGCAIFPADTIFHADIRALPVHPDDATWRAHLGHDAPLRLPARLDRSQGWPGVRYGVPHALADAQTRRRRVIFDGFYPTEQQFPGPYPLPAGLDVQTGFDQQTIVLETDACELYELIGYSDILAPAANGGAWFDLAAHGPAPEGWAVTASRLPILATQVRADDITRGRIDHVLAFSVNAPSPDAVWPAFQSDGPSDDPDAPPMGAWLRLRPEVDTTGMPPAVRVVAEALRVHGAILADTGGAPGGLTLKLEKTADWVDGDGNDVSDALSTLGDHITVADLIFVDPTPMQVDATSWQIR